MAHKIHEPCPRGGATAPRGRRRPSVSCGRCATNSERVTGPSSGSPISSATASRACKPGCVRPTSTTVWSAARRGRTSAESPSSSRRTANSSAPTRYPRARRLSSRLLRAPTSVLVDDIDQHKEEFGVEPLLRNTAGGLQHLQRCEVPPALGARPARRGASRRSRRSARGQLLWLGRPHDGEGDGARCPRGGSRPGGPVDGHRGPARSSAKIADAHDSPRRHRAALGGPRRTELHGHGTQPALGHRPDLRADLAGRHLRPLHHRRLQPDDRRADLWLPPCVRVHPHMSLRVRPDVSVARG